jgi:alkylation response protein AidB-like acyl-CoA dehydrogenase
MPEPPRPPFDLAAIADGVRALLSAVVADVPDARRSHYVEGVAAACVAVKTARECLDEAVRLARLHGVTWSEIGAELGVSRQAAFQRFGAPSE